MLLSLTLRAHCRVHKVESNPYTYTVISLTSILILSYYQSLDSKVVLLMRFSD
jgi:hypothetical protein